MNQLPKSKKIQIIELLAVGTSLKETSVIADVSTNTTMKLLLEIGRACQKYHDDHSVHLHSLLLRCDEILALEDRKAAWPSRSEIWTWTAIDVDSKFMVYWLLGDRSQSTADVFLENLKSRVLLRGSACHVEVGNGSFFGPQAKERNLLEINSADGTRNTESQGDSIVFRSNALLTNTNLVSADALRKKIENQCDALAFHFFWHNYVKRLENSEITPSIKIGIASKPMSIEDMVNLTFKRQ